MTVKKAVIPAAGLGTRMLPASLAVRKELFPIVDTDGVAKPAMQLIIEEALSAGITEICLIVQPCGEDELKAYFDMPMSPRLRERLAEKPDVLAQIDHAAELGRRLTYVVQETQDGYGHAVWCARDWVGDEPFLLLLGDHVYLSHEERSCARQLVDAFCETGLSTTSVMRTPEDQLHLFGTIAGRREGDTGLYVVTEMIEKPAPEVARKRLRTAGLPEGEYLSFFGTHAFTPDIFDSIAWHMERDVRERGEIQLTNAMDRLRRETGAFYALEIRGERHDIGVPEAYAATVTAFAARANQAPAGGARKERES